MAYRVGELDQRITLQRQVLTSDGQGGATKTWSDLATVWALARARSGAEVAKMGRVEATALYLFVIRYKAGLLASDRIVWGSKNYNIRAINENSARRLFLEIDAEVGVAQ